MLSLFLVATFFVAYSVDVWTPFLDENGAAYDMAASGMELSQFSRQVGGRGGRPWVDDCDRSGGLKRIRMECGRFVGSLKMQCANNRWKWTRGRGLWHGNGRIRTFNARGITLVVIRAGRYIDKVRFYRRRRFRRWGRWQQVAVCGKSWGGRRYVARAPRGMQLCALRGRSGWWMDRLSAGWCRVRRRRYSVTEDMIDDEQIENIDIDAKQMDIQQQEDIVDNNDADEMFTTEEDVETPIEGIDTTAATSYNVYGMAGAFMIVSGLLGVGIVFYTKHNKTGNYQQIPEDEPDM